MPAQPVKSIQHEIGYEASRLKRTHLGVGKRLDKKSALFEDPKSPLRHQFSETVYVESMTLLHPSLCRGRFEQLADKAHLQRQQAMERASVWDIDVHDSSRAAEPSSSVEKALGIGYFVQQAAKNDEVVTRFKECFNIPFQRSMYNGYRIVSPRLVACEAHKIVTRFDNRAVIKGCVVIKNRIESAADF